MTVFLVIMLGVFAGTASLTETTESAWTEPTAPPLCGCAVSIDSGPCAPSSTTCTCSDGSTSATYRSYDKDLGRCRVREVKEAAPTPTPGVEIRWVEAPTPDHSYRPRWMRVREVSPATFIAIDTDEQAVITDLLARDVDVSDDGKTWSHMLGPKCLGDHPKVSPTPEQFGQ